MAVEDLNRLEIQTDGYPRPLQDFSTHSGQVAVYFRDLEKQLIRQIRAADLVVGCVAWLTSEPLLEALSTVRCGAYLIVQKEDFLRPDSGAARQWQRELQQRYTALGAPFDRMSFGGLLWSMSVCGDPSIQAVRCVGNHNREKTPAFPRMHNKFLVFCKVQGADRHGCARIRPYSVWTGSFNLTRNAGLSLENAVVLSNKPIAQAYYDEWEQITALSEPLDWDTPWSEPEWRIGT